MKTKKVNTATVEMTERVNVNVIVSDNPKKVSKDITKMVGAKSFSQRVKWTCQQEKCPDPLYANGIRILGTENFYLILDKNDEFKTNIFIISGITSKICSNLSNHFDKDLLFAKLVLAAFGKEAA